MARKDHSDHRLSWLNNQRTFVGIHALEIRGKEPIRTHKIGESANQLSELRGFDL
jgi:hypothetical protein